MRISPRALGATIALLMAPATCADVLADDAADAFFESKVRPILVARCLECHGDLAKPKGGLRLTSRDAALKGGDSGPAAIAGDPAASPIVASIRYLDEPRMPPKGKLPDDEVATLERWVALGLPFPGKVEPQATDPAAPFHITPEQRQFWSFRPVRAVEVPEVKDEGWSSHPVDRFLLAGLKKAGLAPAPEADRPTLIRRLSYDLTGLPPTAAEVRAFLDDPAPDAYEKVVDRLLASPAHGPRWGRHWLDVARYADSRDARGVGGSDDIADAWRYRDWVVDAINRDLPYDQFIIHQVAGDQIHKSGPDDPDVDAMVATGLLAIGEWGTGDADKEKMLTDIVADQVDVVTRGFLGLTVACARCHDHKFDPISTADYYALAGIFSSTRILPDPGPKTAGSPMLRTPLVTKARREAIRDHARRLAEAEGAAKAAREATAKALAPRLRDMLRAGRGLEPPGDLPAFAVRRWAACLASIDPGRTLSKMSRSINGNAGVDFWTGEADTPWVGVNATAAPVAIGTLTLPPRSVDLHPGPKSAAAIRWRSPVDGMFKIEGDLGDADPNGGNGVGWSLATLGDGPRREVAAGGMDNGGKARFHARASLRKGDLVELAVGPRGEYSFDTTTVRLIIATEEPTPQVWDVAADLVPDLAAANPHADRMGNADVWSLVEVAPGKSPRPLADHPAWAEWDRSDRSAAALDALASRFEGDPKLMAALLGDGGPFRPDAGDEDAAIPDLARLKGEVARIKGQAPPPPPLGLVALEGGVPKSAYEGFHDARIQVRGDYRRLGAVVPRRVPEVVAGEHPPAIREGSGRMELARWIASRDNPLTARVMVNRVWQGHFGSPLVRTPGNFGKLGEPPTHPELLDWLAGRFMNDGWSLKKLHRLLVTSRAYRQVSRPSADALRLDPENRLWGRMERRRLEAEAVRDALLAASGRLDPALGGPSTRDFNSPRRTLYQMTIRSDRSSFGPLFDAADSTAIVERRVVSTVAPQALFLMNHPFVIDQARGLADRLGAITGRDERIRHAYVLLFARAPSDEELAIGRDLVGRIEGAEGSEARAWQAYAQVLLCSNEFLYVD